jgi:protein-disulfide isomerase
MELTARGAWEVASAGTVALVGVVMLALFLHDRRQASIPPVPEPVYAEDWRDWGVSGIRMGPPDGPMVVAVFSDFRCPYCRDLVPILDSLVEEFRPQVTIEFHHYPLSLQGLSVLSAVAAECADQQGRFWELYRTLFRHFDSVEVRAWEVLASEAGVGDLTRFGACIEEPSEAFARIAGGRALGERVGVRGVPSVWINGELFRGERSLAALRKKVEELGFSASGR